MRIAQASSPAFNEGVMHQSCEAYRGYAIELRVAVSRALLFSGMQRRYTVWWAVCARETVCSLPVKPFPSVLTSFSQTGLSTMEKSAHGRSLTAGWPASQVDRDGRRHI